MVGVVGGTGGIGGDIDRNRVRILQNCDGSNLALSLQFNAEGEGDRSWGSSERRLGMPPTGGREPKRRARSPGRCATPRPIAPCSASRRAMSAWRAPPSAARAARTTWPAVPRMPGFREPALPECAGRSIKVTELIAFLTNAIAFRNMGLQWLTNRRSEALPIGRRARRKRD